MDAFDFKNRFRVSRSTFSEIVCKMSGLERQNTCFREAISVEKRTAIALYALGSSSEYRTVADLFGVGRSTVGEIVLEFCDEVVSVYGDMFKSFYPPTEEKIKENVQAFEKMGFPQCYGAIDGCHIKVKPRKSEAKDFYNFKGIVFNIQFRLLLKLFIYILRWILCCFVRCGRLSLPLHVYQRWHTWMFQ